jgi:hypothetical protein
MSNLEEVGGSDWEDRKTKEVIAFAAMFGQTIHQGVSRNVKSISVIACLSAARESLLHYMVRSQNSSTVQKYLTEQGIRFGGDFALKFDQKPCFKAGIFIADIRTIISSYLDSFRGRAVVAQEIAVLLRAHCSAYVTGDVLRILTEARVRVITFAPHTTQVFQILDLTLFGVLKRCTRYELTFDDDSDIPSL